MSNLIAVSASELRRIVAAEPKAPHARKQQQVGDLTVTLSRSRNQWALTLHAERPIQQEMAELWAKALGVPLADWWRTDEDRRWRADWHEHLS